MQSKNADEFECHDSPLNLACVWPSGQQSGQSGRRRKRRRSPRSVCWYRALAILRRLSTYEASLVRTACLSSSTFMPDVFEDDSLDCESMQTAILSIQGLSLHCNVSKLQVNLLIQYCISLSFECPAKSLGNWAGLHAPSFRSCTCISML